MNQHSRSTIKQHAALILTFILPVASAFSAEQPWWPQFRGPNGSGISETAKPPAEFGPGTNQLWKVAVPSGASSPCIWEGRIFLTAFENGKLETLCLDRTDGKLLWKREAAAEKIEEFHPEEGSPAASTCVTDGKNVVSYFGSCGLVCYDFEGKELWQHKLPVAETSGGFGSGTSPVIVKGLVLVNRDQQKTCSLLAVDLKTGKQAWETPRLDVSQSFGTPIFWNNEAADEVVMPGSLKLKGYDLKTGTERWSLAGMPSFSCTSPVLGDGLLYFGGWAPGKEPGTAPSWEALAKQFDLNHDGVITAEEAKTAHFGFFHALDSNGDGKLTSEDMDLMSARMAKGENVLVAVKPGGHGELGTNQVAWKQTVGLPYVPSPLFYHGRIYLVRDGGMASSFDAKTGTVFYQKERLDAAGNYYASPVAADGRIYFISLQGKLSVVAEGGDLPKILRHVDFGERICCTPALVENKIYLRTESSFYAFGQ